MTYLGWMIKLLLLFPSTGDAMKRNIIKAFRSDEETWEFYDDLVKYVIRKTGKEVSFADLVKIWSRVCKNHPILFKFAKKEIISFMKKNW